MKKVYRWVCRFRHKKRSNNRQHVRVINKEGTSKASIRLLNLILGCTLYTTPPFRVICKKVH